MWFPWKPWNIPNLNLLDSMVQATQGREREREGGREGQSEGGMEGGRDRVREEWREGGTSNTGLYCVELSPPFLFPSSLPSSLNTFFFATFPSQAVNSTVEVSGDKKEAVKDVRQ